jgi:glycosyltransferase involved in cell wall biosynthesis
MQELPLVSAVIPTRNRPHYVLRAMESVFRQTYPNLEVVVVIDGPDADTRELLSTIADPRLRVVGLEESVGGSEARNCGVRASSGKWVALLDDDDEWMNDKIRQQVEIAEGAANPYIIVSSQMIVRYAHGDEVCPRRLPHTNEPMSEFLFIRKGLTSGEGFIQTSSFFASRQMFDEVPFRKGQKLFQDTDWLLRASARPGARVEVIPEPLVVYYMNHEQAVSRKPDWEYLYKWMMGNRELFTPRAFSFFLATQCVPRAAKQKEPIGVFFKLLKECIFDGSPTLNCVAICFVLWFIPDHRRQKLRDIFSRSKNDGLELGKRASTRGAV